MATAKPTTDHDQIRKWVEARGGHPARVKATGRGKDPGILRIDFPGFSGEGSLEEISWDEFFDWFDRNNLAILLSSERGNRFNKLVERTAATRASSAKKSARKTASPAGKSSAGKSSAKTASAKKSSAKKSSAKKAGAKPTASTKSSGKTASSAKASAAKSSAKKASAKKTSSTKTSAKKGSAQKASAQKSSAKTSAKTGAKKTSSKSTAPKATAAKKTSSKKSTTRRSTGSGSKTTTNHDEIRRWVESRGGFPATVAGTESRGEEAGLLRIDYPGFSGGDTLDRIDWDAWFQKFDEENLAFLYQDKKNSRFSKLVRR